MSIKDTAESATFDSLRKAQKSLEEGFIVSPVAYSTDGRLFHYETSLNQPFIVGAYVLITTQAKKEYLGQVILQETAVKEGPEYGLSVETSAGVAFITKGTTSSSNLKGKVQIRHVRGHGLLLRNLTGAENTTTNEKDIFHDASIAVAPNRALIEYLAYAGADSAAFEVGRALHGSAQARVLLRANGFDRHTFLCGQSGSGKTFGLTNLKIIVLDPNSDFVGLNRLRKLTGVNKTRSVPLMKRKYDDIARRYAKLKGKIRILRPPAFAVAGVDKLQIRFSDLEDREQATILNLDPLHDREEYYSFGRIIRGFEGGHYSLRDISASITKHFSKEARDVWLRIENLGIADWDIWCSAGGRSVVDVLQEDWRCLVIDIGTLSDASQKTAVAMAVLGYLWADRHKRQPVLVVIDKAHNLCPQQPSFALEQNSMEHVIRIAGEGRKFGLYLLLATQRPIKLHSNAVSQCDNLFVMRMNSSADLVYIGETFSQVPHNLLSQSPAFSQGEVLIAGKIVPSPMFAKYEGRLSHEGGSDVPTTWAARLTAHESGAEKLETQRAPKDKDKWRQRTATFKIIEPNYRLQLTGRQLVLPCHYVKQAARQLNLVVGQMEVTRS